MMYLLKIMMSAGQTTWLPDGINKDSILTHIPLIFQYIPTIPCLEMAFPVKKNERNYVQAKLGPSSFTDG